MSTVSTARALNVGGDERAITFTELDATMSMAFREQNVMWDGALIRRKTLEGGAVSHDFPIFGTSPEDAEHHTPGQFIEGGTVVNAKVNVSLDDPIIKALRLPLNDQQISKWDHIKPYALECARLIVEKMDKRGIRLLSLAARTGSVASVHDGGKIVELTGQASKQAHFPVSDAGAITLANAFADMARKFDESSIPKANRYALIDPYLRQVLTRSNRLMNRDYVMEKFGSIVDRSIGMLEGFQLLETLHLPSTNVTTDLSKYNGDFSIGGAGQPAALCWYNGNEKGPLAGVEVAGGMYNKVYFDENRDCWLIKSRMHNGMGTVEVWCAGEIRIKT